MIDKSLNLHGSIRILLRKILRYLVKKTIKKHNPLIIAVTGEYNPSTLREVLYAVLNTKYNARRNLERTESEFSIPLTIFGVLYYPGGYFQWAFLILKVFIQLIYLKRYKHALVIQINQINDNIYKFWLDALSPDIVVNTANRSWRLPMPTLREPRLKSEALNGIVNSGSQSRNTRLKHSYNISNNEIDLISSGILTETLKKICKELAIEEKLAESVIKKLPSPMPRINFIPAKNGSTIIDARYYYYPPSINAVIEIADSLRGSKYIFTNIKKDFDRIPRDYIICTDLPDKLSDNSIYIFRGSKNKYLKEISKLSSDIFWQ